MNKAYSLLATLVLLGACSHGGTSDPPVTSAAAAPPANTSTTATTASDVGAALIDGAQAPDFDVHASDGTDLALKNFKGKTVVVYFYPKDETPGCTKEACAFRDAWDGLSKAGLVLIGVSADSDESHKAFSEHHKLPFYLVSDPKGTLAASFGVPFQDGYTARQSFLIGPDGKLKKVYRKVDVTQHAAQIAGDLK